MCPTKKNERFNSFLIIFAFVLVICGTPYAFAQQLRQEQLQLNLVANERYPKELRPEGIEQAGFILKPRLLLQGSYDSNVLAQENNEKSDFIITVAPSIGIQKKYRNHNFVFGGKAFVDRYLSESNENAERYQAYFRGVLDGNSQWQFPFSAIYNVRPRNRSIPLTNLAADRRLNINTFVGEIGVTRRFNRLSLTLMGDYTNITNEDGTAIVDKSRVVFSDDDRQRTGAKLKLRYEIPRNHEGNSAEHILFADGIYGQTKYENRQFENARFSGAIGDNTEYGILAGFETTYKGLLFANVGVGALRRSFEDSALKDVSIFDLYADVSYNILPKLTLNAEAGRNIDQDSGLAQGVVTSNYQIGIDYELLHDLYAGLNIGLTNFDFETSAREDTSIRSKIYLKKYHSRNFESGLEMRYEDRTSNTSGNEFDRLEFVFRLTGKI